MAKKSEKSSGQKEVKSTGVVFEEDVKESEIVEQPASVAELTPEPVPESEVEQVVEKQSEIIEQAPVELVVEPLPVVEATVDDETNVESFEKNFDLPVKEEIENIIKENIETINPKSLGRGKYRVMIKLGKV